MTLSLLDKIVRTLAEHHCETTNQQMVEKLPKLGEPNHTLLVGHDKTSLVAALCAAAANVYCEEHGLEMTGVATPQ